MTILDRETLARILALPGFDGPQAPPRGLDARRHGLPTLRLIDVVDHDGWQAIRKREDDDSSQTEWWRS
jgi:hypothetical protein